MTAIYIILAILLTVLFSFNIKNTATILCRIAGGFAFLYIYNSVAPLLSIPALGINVLSAAICGILGIPGGLLLLCLNL